MPYNWTQPIDVVYLDPPAEPFNPYADEHSLTLVRSANFEGALTPLIKIVHKSIEQNLPQ